MVNKVAQISFNGKIAREKGQEVMIVTERAVFKLCKEGVVLIEVAPGIDLQTQVLDMMDFKPILAKEIKTMNKELFNKDTIFNLKKILEEK